MVASPIIANVINSISFENIALLKVSLSYVSKCLVHLFIARLYFRLDQNGHFPEEGFFPGPLCRFHMDLNGSVCA